LYRIFGAHYDLIYGRFPAIQSARLIRILDKRSSPQFSYGSLQHALVDNCKPCGSCQTGTFQTAFFVSPSDSETTSSAGDKDWCVCDEIIQLNQSLWYPGNRRNNGHALTGTTNHERI
jgi:hypothetical protein